MRFIQLLALLVAVAATARAQRVVDIPTRPGVTQRLLVHAPPEPRATLVLLPGGHGGLQIFPGGSLRWGDTNFLVRTRQLFADRGFHVVVVDAPSDRLTPPFLAGFRNKPEHAQDLKAVIAWARQTAPVPVWLVGTSRGTQSAAYVATQLTGPEGPDGVVLTSSILVDERSPPVPALPLGDIRVPVLVVHHTADGCALCPFAQAQTVIERLAASSRKELVAFEGGHNTGDPCAAMAYHGFNGLEPAVVDRIGQWVLAR